MNFSKIYKLSGMSLLALSLAVIPSISPGQAQTDPETEIAVIETEDDGFDWGLLGLLGLFGLAGLAGKKNSHASHEVHRGTEPFPETVTSPRDR